MNSSSSNYQFLLAKLDGFIRKYYKNQAIRGAFYFSTGLLATYILFTLLEYNFYFSTSLRAVLFYSFIITNAFVFCLLVLKPLLAYYSLGQIISHQKAAEIVGNHFSEIKDKLLNTLQLHQLSDNTFDGKELIEASINQKSLQLNPIPFGNAINLQENRKYVKFIAIPVSIILLVVLIAPEILSESTGRLLNYGTFYERKAPFEINLINKKMSAVQHDDFLIEVKLSGSEIPQEIYLVDGENSYKLDKKSIIKFDYEFKNLQKTKKFRFRANGFLTKEYELTILPNPTITNLSVILEYPPYLKKNKESLSNAGDLTIPAGTKISWNFTGSGTDAIEFSLGAEKTMLTNANNRFNFSKRIFRNTSYYVKPLNNQFKEADSLAFTISVIPDAFPTISVEEKKDSVRTRLIYFVGDASDDYGLNRLSFHYRFTKTSNTQKLNKLNSIPVILNSSGTASQFYYSWNMADAGIEMEEEFEYYFEVWDNDGVNGSKSSRSALKTYKAPSSIEITKQQEESSQSLKDKLSDAAREAEKLQKETKKLTEKLAEKKSLNFEDKKSIEQLLNQQKQLENEVKEIAKDNKTNNQRDEEFKKSDENILEKQKELQNMFENILDEKTKDLLKQLEKLLNENNKNDTQENLEKLNMDNQSLEKELDRMLELYKQLEFEQKFDDALKKLDDLAKKQEELSSKTNEGKPDENIKSEQKEIEKLFEEVKDDLKALQEKNEAMEEKTSFENPEKDQQDIDKSLNDSEKSLENNNGKKAASSQKEASDKMKKLSEKLKEMKAEGDSDELELNMQALREILENLLKVSFDQEKTMQNLKKTAVNDPNYLTLTQKQKFLKDDLSMIKDSLYALSKKVAKIKSFVNKEIGAIDLNLQKSIENLAERRTAEANNRQQYVMTSVNNLAVMLSEVLGQMQAEAKAMKESKPGDKPGKKPGKKPGGSGLSQMQQKLNQQLQQMQNGMKPGEKPGKGQMSEQMAKMAAQQQAIRSALEKLSKEQGNDGKGSGTGSSKELSDLAKEMEKTETELYNKTLNPETYKRQTEILTRLLESEKAEREREYDNKRESKEGKNLNEDFNPVFEEYKKLKLKETEFLQTVPPSLNSYYRNKIDEYFKNLSTK